MYNISCPIQPYWKNITNNKCEDDFNSEACGWDGGACCYEKIDDSRCTYCLCHEDGTRHPSHFTNTVPERIYYRNEKGIDFFYLQLCQQIMGPKFHTHIGDLICDDVANNRFCNYDMGDCCTPWSATSKIVTVANFKRCEEHFCTCHVTGVNTKQATAIDCFGDPGHLFDRDKCAIALFNKDFTCWNGIRNGICTEDLNIFECGFDGGDCLVYEDPGKSSPCMHFLNK